MSHAPGFALNAQPGRLGVDLWLAVPIGGRTVEQTISLTREEARAWAQQILRAAGDGTERTFSAKTVKDGQHGLTLAVPPPVAIDPPAAPQIDRAAAVAQGFSGDACRRCGSLLMVRTGTCQTCQACGTTSGCS